MPADNQPVKNILTQVIEDKSIRADQVRELEQFVKQDWVIDNNEVKFLFRVNQALGASFDSCPEWSQFFMTSVCRLVVMDLNSPGQIDEAEGDWLEEMFVEFSVGNESEKKLLAELQKTTTSVAGKFSHRIQPG